MALSLVQRSVKSFSPAGSDGKPITTVYLDVVGDDGVAIATFTGTPNGENSMTIDGGFEVSPTGAYQFGNTYDAVANASAFSGPSVIIGADDSTGKGAKLAITSDSNDANTPGIHFYSSKGTLAAPEVNGSSDGLGGFSVYGFDGTSFFESSQIFATVGASPTTGHVPGRVGISVEDGTSSVVALDISGGTKITKIRADNGIAQSAPASTTAAILASGQISFYLDEVGNKLKVAVKYSNGTTKTGEVSLV